MDKDQVRKAMDAFEEEDYVTSKEILQKEVKAAKAAYLQSKLGLVSFGAPEQQTEPAEEN